MYILIRFIRGVRWSDKPDGVGLDLISIAVGAPARRVCAYTKYFIYMQHLYNCIWSMEIRGAESGFVNIDLSLSMLRRRMCVGIRKI